MRMERDTGPYEDGKKHGSWTEAYDGGSAKGSYEDGKKHGIWREYWRVEDGLYDWKDIIIAAGPYESGKKHGKWLEVSNDFADYVNEGLYVNGEKHGKWHKRLGRYYGPREIEMYAKGVT